MTESIFFTFLIVVGLFGLCWAGYCVGYAAGRDDAFLIRRKSVESQREDKC